MHGLACQLMLQQREVQTADLDLVVHCNKASLCQYECLQEIQGSLSLFALLLSPGLVWRCCVVEGQCTAPRLVYPPLASTETCKCRCSDGAGCTNQHRAATSSLQPLRCVLLTCHILAKGCADRTRAPDTRRCPMWYRPANNSH